MTDQELLIILLAILIAVVSGVSVVLLLGRHALRPVIKTLDRLSSGLSVVAAQQTRLADLAERAMRQQVTVQQCQAIVDWALAHSSHFDTSGKRNSLLLALPTEVRNIIPRSDALDLDMRAIVYTSGTGWNEEMLRTLLDAINAIIPRGHPDRLSFQDLRQSLSL